MHELQIATNIIDTVRKEMVKEEIKTVRAVGLRLGALSGFNPDALRFSFDAAIIDSPLSKTRLEIEFLQIRAVCRECGKDSEFEECIFLCPSCGSSDLDVKQGEELEITYIEGE